MRLAMKMKKRKSNHRNPIIEKSIPSEHSRVSLKLTMCWYLKGPWLKDPGCHKWHQSGSVGLVLTQSNRWPIELDTTSDDRGGPRIFSSCRDLGMSRENKHKRETTCRSCRWWIPTFRWPRGRFVQVLQLRSGGEDHGPQTGGGRRRSIVGLSAAHGPVASVQVPHASHWRWFAEVHEEPVAGWFPLTVLTSNNNKNITQYATIVFSLWLI